MNPESPRPNHTEESAKPEVAEIIDESERQRIRDRVITLNNYLWGPERGASAQVMMDNYAAIGAYLNQLREKYEDSEVESTELKHLAIGSSIGPSMTITRFDFGGEDSILSFLERLYRENIAAGKLKPEPTEPQTDQG